MDKQRSRVERSTWDKPLEFVLSCLGYAIGLGNVWRFPYLCYKNGGGAFLVTYFIMLVLMGMPIFFLELVIGQYSGLGPVQAFSSLTPIFNGLGYCTLMVISLVTIYYMVIIAWIVFYFFASFTTELRFGSCHNDFNTIGCYSATEDMNCGPNATYYAKSCISIQTLCQDHGYDGAIGRTHCFNLNNTTTVHIGTILNRTLASSEYFHQYVLDIGESNWDNFGYLNWKLILCLLFAWIIGYLCVVRGVKTSGKAVYFTALFPYVILTGLVVQGVFLDGAIDGILIYITPKWAMLLEVDVWANAASQTFYSFGIACGSLITLASYNDFYNNCLKDTLIVTATNAFTSIYAGFAIFAMLGFLAKQMGVPVEQVAQDGPGLAFIAYPEAILRLPAPTIWALLFFFMLFILGLGSQFAGIETISCLILDKWPKMRKYQSFVILTICICCFLLAIPMCFQGGIYLFILMEWNTASWAILLIGLMEVGIVAWLYGCHRFLNDLNTMNIKLSRLAKWYWWCCWVIITPLTLLGVFMFQMINWTTAVYENYIFPLWADLIGWLIGLSTLAPLFVFPIFTLYKRKFNGWQLFQPTTKWRPQIRKAESSLTLTKEKLSPTESIFDIDSNV